MGAAEQKRARDVDYATNTSEDAPVTQETRRRDEDLHPTPVIDKEVVKEHARWWGPGLGAHWDAAHASPLEGVDASIPNWPADQCNTAPSQELPAVEGNFVRGTGQRCQGA